MKTLFALLAALAFVTPQADGQSPSVLLFGRRASAGVSDPSGANTLYAWWVASDLTLNWNVGNTNAWTDRIKSILLRQSNTSSYPSNNSSGLEFNGSGVLTNAPTAQGTNSTVAIIFRPRSLNTANGLMSIWTVGNSFNGQLAVRQSNNKFSWYNSGFNDFGEAVVVSNLYTVTLVQSNTTMHAYTNGVFAGNFSQTPPVTTGWTWRNVADDDTADGNFDGWIRECLIWTNILTSAQIGNVHNYATSTYP
jgi:hypothetical protein